MRIHSLVIGAVAAGLFATSITTTLAAAEAPGADEARPAAVPSAGCAGPAASSGWAEEGSLMIDGVERTWQVHVPPAHDGVTPVPLVLLLHGLGEDAGIIRNFTTSGLPMRRASWSWPRWEAAW